MIEVLKIISTVIAIVLGLGLSPLLDGIARKVKARIQYRCGPTVLQTFYDLAKLLSMESVVPTENKLFILAPYIAFASSLAAMTVLPIGGVSPLSFTGDLFVFLYVLAMVSVALMIAGFVVQNIYSNIGANREMMLILSIEPILGLSIGILALLTGTLSIEHMIKSISNLPPLYIALALIAYGILMYAVYVEGGFIPFDVAEAETEILEGPLCEYSGKLLALFKWGLLMKRLALVWLFSSLIVIPVLNRLDLPLIHSYILTLMLQLITAILLYIAIAINEAYSARLRIDQVISLNMRAFFVSLLLFAIAAVSRFG